MTRKVLNKKNVLEKNYNVFENSRSKLRKYAIKYEFYLETYNYHQIQFDNYLR